MKLCGIFGVLLALVSLFFWAIHWVYFTFLMETVGYDSPLRHLANICGALDAVSLTVAVVIVSIGLLLGAKQKQ